MSRSVNLLIPSLVVAATCVTASAHAQDVPEAKRDGWLPPRAFEIGMRAGLGLGFGESLQRNNGDRVRLVDSGNFTVPLWLDLGVRIHRNFYVGAFGQYQYVNPKRGVDSFCERNAATGVERDECSAYTLMGGLMGRVHFLPSSSADPWIGVGFAYEYLKEGWTDATPIGRAEQSASFKGFQFFNLQAGADFDLGGGWKLGPYAAFALTQFTRVNASLTGAGPLSASFDGPISEVGETRIHGWTNVGIRGLVGL